MNTIYKSKYSANFNITNVKLIYSEKATKIFKIFTLHVVPVKSKVKISQNFVAFSEYMNFRRQKGFINHSAYELRRFLCTAHQKKPCFFCMIHVIGGTCLSYVKEKIKQT